MISRPRSGDSSARNTQAPVPVNRASPNCDNQSIARATGAYRRRTTPKQSFLPPEARKPLIVVGGEFLVNSGSWNTAPVLTNTFGFNNQIVTLSRCARWVEQGQPLPDPFRKRRSAVNEHRHIGAQFEADLRQCFRPQSEPPKPVQRHQAGGGIGTAAPQPCSHGNPLHHVHGCSQRASRRRLQGPRRAQGQILFRVDAGGAAQTGDFAVGTDFDVDVVAQIDELEAGLQLVIAVRRAARGYAGINSAWPGQAMGALPRPSLPRRSSHALPMIHGDAHPDLLAPQHDA